jgi:hypothetical protein
MKLLINMTKVCFDRLPTKLDFSALKFLFKFGEGLCSATNTFLRFEKVFRTSQALLKF